MFSFKWAGFEKTTQISRSWMLLQDDCWGGGTVPGPCAGSLGKLDICCFESGVIEKFDERWLCQIHFFQNLAAICSVFQTLESGKYSVFLMFVANSWWWGLWNSVKFHMLGPPVAPRWNVEMASTSGVEWRFALRPGSCDKQTWWVSNLPASPFKNNNLRKSLGPSAQLQKFPLKFWVLRWALEFSMLETLFLIRLCQCGCKMHWILWSLAARAPNGVCLSIFRAKDNVQLHEDLCETGVSPVGNLHAHWICFKQTPQSRFMFILICAADVFLDVEVAKGGKFS